MTFNRFFRTIGCSSLFAAAVMGNVGCAQSGPAGLLKIATPPADQTLHYGSDPLQFGELRLPKAGGLVPIVIIVHGGCWMDSLPHLDPRMTTYELLKPLASALASRGVATWNVEYRRAGSRGGGWPATYLDLAAATDYLKKIAPAYKLDLARVVVIGHSSGGSFALWIGARGKLPKTSEIYTKDPLAMKAIVDIDGPPELAQAEPSETDYCPVAGIDKLMDGTPSQQSVRYHDGSVEAFLPLGIPQVIVTAGLLQTQPGLVTTYQAAAKEKGEAVSILPFDQSGHFDMLDPQSDAGKTLIAAVLKAAGPAK